MNTLNITTLIEIYQVEAVLCYWLKENFHLLVPVLADQVVLDYKETSPLSG